MVSSVTIEFSLDHAKFIQNLTEKQVDNPNFNLLIISNISTFSNGLKLMFQWWFKVTVIEKVNLFGINLEVKEKVDVNFHQEPPFFHFKEKKFFLISIQSKEEGSGCKIFWRVGSKQKIYSILIEDDENQVLSKFVQEFLTNEIKEGRTGILEQFQSKCNIKLHELGDKDENNLLNVATLAVESTTVQNLLKYEFILDDAVDLAWNIYEDSNDTRKEESNKIILHLLHANSSLPIDFNFENASIQVQQFVKMCESLHEDITANNLSAIETKLVENPTLVHFYDRNNQSLLAHALDNKKLDIFKVLNRGITIGSHEELPDVYRNLSVVECQQLRTKHKLNSFELPDSHVLILRSKSRIGNNDRFSFNKWKYIDEAYRIMNENPFINKTMRIAAECRNLQIYFDFKHDSVYYLDPASSIYSSGNIYGTRTIYIGAKYLLDDEEKYEVIGVLAHEICHLSTRIAFMNSNYDPFPTGESANKTNYLEKVMTQCMEHQKSETMIEGVFRKYPKEYHDSEMIVTIPQMMMQYYKNPKKLRENENIYSELFGYARNVVQAEYDNALVVLKMLFDEELKIKYSNLTEPMKAKIRHSKVNFQGVSSSLSDIIGDDQDILESLTPIDIRKILIRDVKLIINGICQMEDEDIFIDRNFIHINTYKEIKQHFDNPAEFSKKLEQYKENGYEIIRKSSIFLLADNAGMGKTTIFKNLTLKLKRKYNNSWVSFINLRRYCHIFEKYATKIQDLTLSDVIEILLHIIRKQNSKIEEDIFKKCFYGNKTILLFDGFDEISPKYKKLLLKIFKILQLSKLKNCICISTRPHHRRELEEILTTSAHKLSPCTEMEIKNFVSKILTQKQIGKTDDVFEKYNIHLQSDKFYCKDDWNLLMLQMITELLAEDPSLELNMVYRYSIYESMIEKQKSKLGLKVENEDCDKLRTKLTVWDVHIVLALHVVLFQYGDEMKVNIEDLMLVKRWKRELGLSKSQPIWSSHSVTRYGFVCVDDNFNIDSIEFIHKSYAEYFVAKFIVESICDDDIMEAEVQKISTIIDFILSRSSEFVLVNDFITSYMMNVWKFRNNKFNCSYKHFLKQKIQKIHEDMKNRIHKTFYNYLYIYLGDLELLLNLWGESKASSGKSLSDVQKIIFENFESAEIFNFCDTFEFIFGLNFFETLNKSEKKLISKEEIEELRTPQLNKNHWREGTNILKLLDFVDKNFENSKKIMFLNHENLFCIKSDKIILKIFNLFSNSMRVEEFAKKFLFSVNFHTNHSSFLTEIFEVIEAQHGNDQNLIRRNLFDEKFLCSLLENILYSQNVLALRSLKTFLSKYKASALEIQEIVLGMNVESFSRGFLSTVYAEFKGLLFENFVVDFGKLKMYIEDAVDSGRFPSLFPDSPTRDYCENFENLLSIIYSRDNFSR